MKEDTGENGENDPVPIDRAPVTLEDLAAAVEEVNGKLAAIEDLLHELVTILKREHPKLF